jgi:TonB family protein
MRPDTPPRLPIPAERLSELKSHADVVAASRLADGSPAPAQLTLPQLANKSEVLKYMLDHYPSDLRDGYDFEMPWAWLFVDEHGQPRDARIVKSSGRPGFDSLALAALRIARFEPALVAGKPLGVWVPLPIEVSYKGLAERAPDGRPRPDGPHFTPYTVKPELLNRNDVAKALVRNYPPQLRSAGIGGKVLLWMFVDQNGQTAKTQVRTSSGNTELDSAALAVARSMRWSPARNGDEVAAVWIMVPIVFKAATPRP